MRSASSSAPGQVPCRDFISSQRSAVGTAELLAAAFAVSGAGPLAAGVTGAAGSVGGAPACPSASVALSSRQDSITTLLLGVPVAAGARACDSLGRDLERGLQAEVL